MKANTKKVKNKSDGNYQLIKSFIPRYKKHTAHFTLDMLSSVVIACIGIALPLVIRDLLYTGISDGVGLNLSYIITLGSLILGLKLIEAGAKYIVTTVGHVVGAKIEAEMRSDLYSKYLSLQHEFYDNSKVGHLMSRITSDLFEVTELSHHCPEIFLITTLKIVGSFIILSTINFPLTLIIYGLTPFMVVFAIYFNDKMNKAFLSQRKKIADINANVEDSLSGIRVVKSFNAENLEKNKFENNNSQFLQIKKRTYKYMGLFHSGIDLFNGIMYPLCVVVGCIFISRGELTAIDLIAFLLYTDSLLVSISMIMEFTEQFQLGLTGIRRFNEMMQIDVTIKSEDNAKDIKIKGEIEYKNISFKYGSNLSEVLHNVSLTAKVGETIALVGASGGGKSTLVNLLPRFYDVTEGEILIDGINVKDITLNSLRQNIGVVSQDVYLFYGTILDNIAYGDKSRSREEIEAAAVLAGASEFIDKLKDGYDTVVGERGVKLSGGQKQRISIARVFLKNPPILLLDEATSSLDNESEKIVQKSLATLSKNRTTLVVAHRLSTIRNADKIAVIEGNGIVEIGTHDELIDKGGVYYNLYNS